MPKTIPSACNSNQCSRYTQHLCRSSTTSHAEHYWRDACPALDLAVEFLDDFFEVVFADVHDAEFAFRAFFGIAGVGGVDHNGLAEFAADGTGRRL